MITFGLLSQPATTPSNMSTRNKALRKRHSMAFPRKFRPVLDAGPLGYGGGMQFPFRADSHYYWTKALKSNQKALLHTVLLPAYLQERDMDHLQTEARNPSSTNLDELTA